MIKLHHPFKPMLLQKSDHPITDKNYISQIKWDGFRSILHYDKTKGTLLFTRHETDCTRQFIPELEQIHFTCDNVILDCECVVLDAITNKPIWEDVMSRFQQSKDSTILQAAKKLPAHLVVFDIVYLNGVDLRNETLESRLQYLQQAFVPSDCISLCPSIDGNAAELFQATKTMGLEGIVSKRRDSLYSVNSRPERVWYKTKAYLEDVFHINAIKKDKFGWVLKSIDDCQYKGVLEFVPEIYRKAFYSIAKQIRKKEDANYIYLEDIIKVKVKFQAYTKQGYMRSPSFIEFVI